MSDRPVLKEDEGESEIEITPEMVAAGARTYRMGRGCGLIDPLEPDEMAEEIFYAMLLASPGMSERAK